MGHIDVFNGDADGICALVQLRLANPFEATLVTGVKRDIKLLDKTKAARGDHVTVLDISMKKNLSQLFSILNQGASVFYVDHHQPGEIPEHSALEAIIDTDPNVCTSLIVDRYLNGAFRAWSVAAAFGDNMNSAAESAAKTLSISVNQLNQLKEIGICINYNGYGSSIEDLHFPPAELYRELSAYRSPFDFINDRQSAYEKLRAGYYQDMSNAQRINPEYIDESVAVYLLPAKTWARRVSGVFANQLANQHPDRAHAVVYLSKLDDYVVSVRAPLNNKTGADELCGRFPTGGGRRGAAGINHLPLAELESFIRKFKMQYGSI
jgi:hypothetical protein